METVALQATAPFKSGPYGEESPTTPKETKNNMVVTQQKRQVVCPSGKHQGTIKSFTETTRDFGNGDKPTLVMLIDPDFKVDGCITRPLEVVWNPELNGLTNTDRLLARLGIVLAEGEPLNMQQFRGLRVNFEVVTKENGFQAVIHDSVTSA